ncbi:MULTISPECIES: hypothetical protein [Enterobacter]|uniref:hypothetical protein n=1 Tax=Enterobacter TaxID=547 RepID=UPI0007973814|nr:hypothetical protein [Enterobacter hormaechei]MCU2787610.1 hypothetical protein [Enterobacter hormaechei subsp. steigerwaltii]GHM23127.1 hypothetical protein EBZU44_16710 [Enterobacter cloacae]DAK59860.1 MAG TPA: hypothetical protein [Caudoviricetes sp.]HCM9560932.1 hypothetical protein [Enterobacter cloacae subsp. cloacae]MBT1694279.1 hypothetical protein [Enterobacter hormaechei subsp. hoffmannii]
MEENSSFVTFLQYLASSGILAIVTALIGWVFVYNNSRALQKRSETWSIVKNVSDNLKEIESSSRKFWVPSDSKEIDAMSFQNEITALLAETERWLNHLKQRIEIDGDYKPLITDLFKDATANIEKVKTYDKSQRTRVSVLVSRRTKIIKALVDESYQAKFLS